MQPEDLGLKVFGGRRRVPGLRREELAQAAGVSADYYVRLEQGRTDNVSQEILDAVADVLGLTADECEHLARLAKPVRRTTRRRTATQRIRPDCNGCWTRWTMYLRSCSAAGWTCWRGTGWPRP